MPETPPQIDVYWSFRSPYSYLATPDMMRLSQDFDLTVNLRPVLPLAVRDPDFFAPDNLKRARYIILDWPRRAEFLGMNHEWPQPDPIVQDLATMMIAEDQPYIHRLTRLGIEAQRLGKGVVFAYEISHLLFGGTKSWDEGSNLADAASRAGLNLDDMEDAIVNGDHSDEIEVNQKALEKAGHWGVPTYVFKNEPFFGQDRIDLLRWRLEKEGLARS